MGLDIERVEFSVEEYEEFAARLGSSLEVLLGLLARRPFRNREDEMNGALAEMRRAAGLHDARIAMIGILPTLTASDLESEAMTEAPPRTHRRGWRRQGIGILRHPGRRARGAQSPDPDHHRSGSGGL